MEVVDPLGEDAEEFGQLGEDLRVPSQNVQGILERMRHLQDLAARIEQFRGIILGRVRQGEGRSANRIQVWCAYLSLRPSRAS